MKVINLVGWLVLVYGCFEASAFELEAETATKIATKTSTIYPSHTIDVHQADDLTSRASSKKTANTQQPLSAFFASIDHLSFESKRLSKAFNKAIVYLPELDGVNWRKRWQLLHSMTLPVTDNTDKWWSRYESALVQTNASAFSVKQPDQLSLPCIISVGKSYEQHVEAFALPEQRGDYNYHPYVGQPNLYRQMVLWHELGHCFETFDGFESEAFADLFAMAMLMRNGQRSDIYELQIVMRWLEMLHGHSLHFTAPVLEMALVSFDSTGTEEVSALPSHIHRWMSDHRDLITRQAHRFSGMAQWQKRLQENALEQSLREFDEELYLDSQQRQLLEETTGNIAKQLFVVRQNRQDLFNAIQQDHLKQDIEQWIGELSDTIGVKMEAPPVERWLATLD